MLDKLGELTARLGDGGTARKAGGAGRPLTSGEEDWIERCLKALIRRVLARRLRIRKESSTGSPWLTLLSSSLVAKRMSCLRRLLYNHGG